MKNTKQIKIFPSILSADFSILADEIKSVEKNSDGIHCDIMDGQFVPNITYGPMIVSKVNEITDLPIDVHLMINNPERLIDEFVKAGADYISVHFENNYHLDRIINYIKSKKVFGGVVINPATPVSVLSDIIKILDFVLIMSVNPGFGGQSFIEYTLSKISDLKKMINKINPDCLIEVDGGISLENIKSVYDSGADIVVAGASVFKSKEKNTIISKMKEKIV